MKGYLIFNHEDGDEIHVRLVSEKHYIKIMDAFEPKFKEGSWDRHGHAQEALHSQECLQNWFTQTGCREPWPYNNIEILGTFYMIIC